MSTYRAGYIEGKVKMSVYVDPTIHKALKLAAVERKESMGDIVERALRKELGLMGKEFEGWSISTGFLAGNLFAESGDDRGTYDVDASAAKYAEMCREELEKEFPGAEVSIPYEVNAQGATPLPLQTYVSTPDGEDYRPGDYGEGGRIADRVEDICDRIWQSWEWVVYEQK